MIAGRMIVPADRMTHLMPSRSHGRTRIALLALLVLVGHVQGEAQAPVAAVEPAVAVPSPEGFFGFRMGEDGKLASWKAIEAYFTTVAAASERVDLVSMGRTTEGRSHLAAVISAPEHLRRLEEIRTANLALADPRSLDARAAEALFAQQPLVLAIGAGIHATEVGGTQAVNELLHDLATSDAPSVHEMLRSLVIVLIPSLNPDGHHLVVEWFEQHRGTPFETSPMPWLYHKYAGHDINRDAFMLTLAESRNVARFFYRVWHPQVFLTLHQMGSRGPRFFVPPNYDPIDVNYDPLLWRAAGLLGHAMALEMERDGRSGVVQNALFDHYWPGYEDSAPLGHNTVCVLAEVASARLALPIDVRPEELMGTPRGLPDYRPQVNFPNPWPGGVWRLRDIVDYDLSALRGLLRGATRYRRELLENFYRMGRRAIDRGTVGGPFAFVVPPRQHDPWATAALVDVLIGGAVEVQQAIEPFRADGRDYPAGTLLVLMAQPFRAYAKTLLERQAYPVRRLVPEMPPEQPYDAAGWTLPLQMGVAVDTIDRPFDLPGMARLDRAVVSPGRITGDRQPSHYLVDARGTAGVLAINRLQAAGVPVSWALGPVEANDAVFPPGALVLPASAQTRVHVPRLARELGLDVVGLRGKAPAPVARLARPRVGLYRPWVESIDEGWTRLLLERFELPFLTMTNDDIREGSLARRIDVLILPDGEPDRLIAGHANGTLPDQYTGGLGERGVAALQAFAKAGGTVVCLDASCRLLIDAMDLPVDNVLGRLPEHEFSCPGSILRIDVDTAHPLAFGMPAQSSAFFANSAAYGAPPNHAAAVGSSASGPNGEVDVRTVAAYGTEDVLLSGWLHGGEHIARRGALLEVRVGRGRIVLFGFRPQHRLQSQATFRLLFNAIYSHPSRQP
jgi:hypothetical protein